MSRILRAALAAVVVCALTLSAGVLVAGNRAWASGEPSCGTVPLTWSRVGAQLTGTAAGPCVWSAGDVAALGIDPASESRDFGVLDGTSSVRVLSRGDWCDGPPGMVVGGYASCLAGIGGANVVTVPDGTVLSGLFVFDAGPVDPVTGAQGWYSSTGDPQPAGTASAFPGIAWGPGGTVVVAGASAAPYDGGAALADVARFLITIVIAVGSVLPLVAAGLIGVLLLCWMLWLVWRKVTAAARF